MLNQLVVVGHHLTHRKKMPFLILNELKQSNIHGLGVFSLENIRKGTIVYKHDKILDGWFDNMDYNAAITMLIKKYCPYDSSINKFIKSCDNVNWMNHSNEPNLSAPTYYVHIASRNILVGEELTVNYKEVSDISDKTEWIIHD